MPEISIKAEPVFHLLGFAVSNSLILSLVVFVFFLIIGIAFKKQAETASSRGGLFFLLKGLLKTIYDMFATILGDKTDYLFPLISAFFMWILFQNWFGLLPGVGSIMVAVHEGEHVLHVPLFRGNNADINATLALAIISVVSMQVFGIKFLGFKTYISKFINFSNPINFFLGFLEIVSEISKILSFAFRLFGNIFAGEVLMTIVAFLVPVLASFPFLILEIFVGMVQALVFAMLSAVFMSLAVSHH